jgi:bla regulator protein BlaR1
MESFMTVIRATLAAAMFAALGFAAPVHAADSRAVADFNSCAKPHYPKESLIAKHQGTVTLGFLVDVSGSVVDARIDTSSGHVPLDEAARDAIKLCKFRPAMSDGKAVQDWAKIQYVWTLK